MHFSAHQWYDHDPNQSDSEQQSYYVIDDIVINYSFSHRDSSVVLTPYGAMVNYINHHRERANVKIIWATKELVAHQPEWLQKDITFLRNARTKIGLSFYYVALRDIKEGEEIFMDYGDDWVNAWEEHVRNWKPKSSYYVHSSEWPEQHLRTLDELEDNPYPSNLHTICMESFQQKGDRLVYHEPVTDLKMNRKPPSSVRHPCDVIHRFVKKPPQHHRNATTSTDRIITYTVKMYFGGHIYTVHNVPRGKYGVMLIDRVQTADWHMPNVFRHPIMIPDEIMPDGWKNKKGG